MSFNRDESRRMEQKSRKRRRFARRLRSAGRAFADASSYDGDGDGFRMNPRTGRDDLPVQPRMQAPNNNGWPDDDDDLDLRRAAGLDGPKPKVPQRPQQIERAKEPRKTVKVTGVSKRDMDDLYFDVFEAMKELLAKARSEGKDPYEEDRQLQARKRLVKLHLYLKELLRQKMITQDGDELSVNVTEEELKRLFKGLESMQKEGYFEDNPVYESLLKQIAKAYRSSFGSLPDYNPSDESKQDRPETETKVLNRRMGRNLLRSARRGATRRPMSRRRIKPMDRPEYDGDADGFITNPLTGRDEIPWAKDRETPEEAIKRFFGGQVPQSIGSMSQPIAQRDRSSIRDLSSPTEGPSDAVAQLLGESSPVSYAARTTQQTPEEGLALLRQYLQNPKIKKRDWAPIGAAVEQLLTSLQAKYGPLETKADFMKALSKNAKVVSTSSWPQRDELTPDERGYLLGVLNVVDQAQGRYKTMTVEIAHSTQPNSSTGAVFPFVPGQSTANGISITRATSTDRITFNYTPNVILTDGSVRDGIALPDNVPYQALRAYLEHVGNNPEGLSPEEIMSSVSLLMGLAIGLHEGGHGVHHASSRRDVWDVSMTDAQIEAEVNKYLATNGIAIAQSIVRSDSIQAIADMHAYLYHQAQGESVAVLSMMAVLEQDPQKRQMLVERVARVRAGEAAMQDLLQLPPTSQTRIKIGNLLRGILTGQESLLAIGELAYEDPDLLDAFYASSHMPIGMTLQQYLTDMLAHPQMQTLLHAKALQSWTLGRMWDGLTDQQIAAVRKAWKYISSYAKDKNSFYNYTYLELASVEGIAELVTAYMLGIGPTDNIPPAAQDAMRDILSWFFGSISYKGIPVKGFASKSVYDLLSMVRSEDA